MEEESKAMKFKKPLIILLCIAMTLSFTMMATACAGNGESSSPEETSSDTANTEEDAAATDDSETDATASGGELQQILDLSDEQLAALDGKQFNLGMLLAMTGNGDYYGRVMSAGAELAAKQIKEMCGLDIQISIEDHQSGDITAGSNGARSLINKNGVASILSSYGNITSAIVPQIQQSKVLTFNPGGANAEQLGIDYLWMGRMLFGDDPMPGIVDYTVANFPEIKKAALICNSENATSVYKDMLPKMWPEKSGGEIVLTETANVGVTEWNQVVTKVKSSGAEVIFTTVSNNDLGYLLKQLREANVDIPVMGVEITDQQVELAGDAGMEGYYWGQDFFNVESENPFAKYFVETYTAENGTAPDFYAANYYQNVFVLLYCMLDILEGGGDINSGEALQESLVKLNSFPTVYGGEEGELATMSFTVDDHSCNLPMGIYKMEGGKPVFLQTLDKVPVSDWQ
jgi:branched-chain amino acid transport system substrate-binding protein